MNNSSNNNDIEFNPNLEIPGMDDVMANRNPQKTNSNMSKSDISKINKEANKPV